MKLRRLARQPFGPWEQRIVPPRPAVRDRETWRSIGYLNNRYSVQISEVDTEWGMVLHLWVRRHDGAMPSSWSDLQRIKTESAGPERVAVQVFPSESGLVDSANMAHLWVLPENMVLPFGLLKEGGAP